MMAADLVTRIQAARLTGFAANTISNWVKFGKLSAVARGNEPGNCHEVNLYRRSDVLRLAARAVHRRTAWMRRPAWVPRVDADDPEAGETPVTVEQAAWLLRRSVGRVRVDVEYEGVKPVWWTDNVAPTPQPVYRLGEVVTALGYTMSHFRNFRR